MKKIFLMLLFCLGLTAINGQSNSKWRDRVNPEYLYITQSSGHKLKLFSTTSGDYRQAAISTFGTPEKMERRGDPFDIGYYVAYCYDGLELYFHEEDNPNLILGFLINSKNFSILVGPEKLKISVGMNANVLRSRFKNSYNNRIKRNNGEELIVLNIALFNGDFSDGPNLLFIVDSRDKIISIQQYDTP